MPVRVAFHQTPALRPKTGVGHYTAQLQAALAQLDPELEVVGIPGRLMAKVYQSAHPFVASRVAAPVAGTPGKSSALRGYLRSGYLQAQRLFFWSLSRQLTPARFDLYHEPNFPILASDVPTVLTWYDLSLVLHPQYHPAERIAKFEKQLPQALAQTSHIVTISDVVREEIIRVLGFPAERVTRTYLGVRPQFRPLRAQVVRERLAALGLPARYLLYVGTLEPRKNLLRLMRAYCALPAALRDACPLLLVGGWGWNIHDMAEYFYGHARHHGVHHVGYVSEDDLAVLYNGARALVYPSHYEGFGLPPLEMMACGGPVLASTAGSLVELFRESAHLTPAEDEAGWRDAMERIIRDDDWHALLRKDVIDAARPFTWERCALETFDVYRKVLGRGLSLAA
jgi:alpha-1,3-rhamnosyl/mannosyltransferase